MITRIVMLNFQPDRVDEFLEILKSRHALLMKERPSKRPGEFKLKPNKAGNTYFVLPKDVMVCKKLENGTAIQSVDIDDVQDDDIIADVGQKTIQDLAVKIEDLKTVVWNGPLGAFEIKPFDQGTTALAKIIAGQTKAGKLISVAGGGDVVCALNESGFIDDFSYISTAGGAFLEWLEGKSLPGIKVLSKSLV